MLSLVHHDLVFCEMIKMHSVACLFNYDGHFRVVEPFLIGVTTTGKPALRGYQTEGTSSGGKVPGWHLFSLSKITGIEVTVINFEGLRPFYNPADKAMLRIDAHV